MCCVRLRETTGLLWTDDEFEGRAEDKVVLLENLWRSFNIPIVANNVPLIRLASGSKTKRGF